MESTVARVKAVLPRLYHHEPLNLGPPNLARPQSQSAQRTRLPAPTPNKPLFGVLQLGCEHRCMFLSWSPIDRGKRTGFGHHDTHTTANSSITPSTLYNARTRSHPGRPVRCGPPPSPAPQPRAGRAPRTPALHAAVCTSSSEQRARSRAQRTGLTLRCAGRRQPDRLQVLGGDLGRARHRPDGHLPRRLRPAARAHFDMNAPGGAPLGV